MNTDHIDKKTIRQFQKTVFSFYTKHKRIFPWRKTRDPYKILVSEIMLQQTQTVRVVPKYREFIRKFPTVYHLAKTSLGEVLKIWQGLGYNRRAKALHASAKTIVAKFNGKVPRDFDDLMSLPSIGKYTAGAILAFAFNKPAIFIETNIRSVFIYHFFPEEEKVADADIIPLLETTLPPSTAGLSIKEWYEALMDYGAYLKARKAIANDRSAHYAKQSPFKGSNRALRGAIIRLLTAHELSIKSFYQNLSEDPERIKAALQALRSEQLIDCTNAKWHLAK